MPDLQALTCPNCGAALTATGNETEIKCQYCGTLVLVPNQNSAPQFVAPQQVIITAPMPGYSSGGVSRAGCILPIVIFGVILAVAGVIVSAVMSSVSTVTSSAFGQLTQIQTIVPAFGQAFEATAAPRMTEAPPPTPAPTRTSTPAPTPLPTAPAYSKLVVRDDFSDKSSGWDRTNSNGNSMDYAQNGYLISIGSAGDGETSWIKDGFKDVSVEVDAQATSGGGWMGVMCRVRQGAGGYSFEIDDSDGLYAIYRYKFSPSGDTSMRLKQGPLDPNLFDASGSNQLRGDCIGKTLTLVINGHTIDQATDSTFSAGGVGLLAVSFTDTGNGLDALFKNFTVKSP
jgi:DNA-directed RNA polymerase subunit RPC12/RpoP